MVRQVVLVFTCLVLICTLVNTVSSFPHGIDGINFGVNSGIHGGINTGIKDGNFAADAGIKLREWPWPAWSSGPPCPARYRQQLLPITGDQLEGALEEVRTLCELFNQELVEIGITSGISVGVVYDQQILFSEGFGTINVDENQPPLESTIYNIGSVTKVFTSLALYNAVQEGMVALTDPVTKFFNEQQPPVFSIHNPYSSEGADAVTLHSLASQASGLPREAFCGAYPVTKNCQNLTEAAGLNMEHLSNFGLLYSFLWISL